MKGKNKIIISIVILLFLIQIVTAIPNSINIQGKLTNPSDNIQTGTFNFTFRIYDAYTGGNKLFEKVNLTSATDSRGVYDIIVKNINISFDKQLYLGIEVNADGEMEPRINLTSTPYSFRANTSDELDVNRSYTVLGLNVTENLTLGDKITFRLRETIDNLVDGFLTITGGLNVTESLIVLGGVNVSGDLSISQEINLSAIGDLDISGGIEAGGGLNLSGDLSVNQQLNITASSGDLVAAGTIGISGTDDSYILGNVGIGTTTPTETLTVIGNVNISGYLNISGDLIVNNKLNITASSGDLVTAGIISAGTLNAISTLNVGGGFDSGGLTIGSDGTITTQGDILFSGNITILNVTHLSVNGSVIPAEDNTFDIGNESLRWRSIYAAGMNLTNNNLELLGDLTVDTTTLFVDSNNNRVGIGKTNPATELDVAGGINASTLNISGNAYLATQIGNVGIGTTSPNFKLDVAGPINASGLNITGSALIKGDLNVTGTSYLGSMTLKGGNITALLGTFTTLNVTGVSYLGDITINADNITTNNIVSRDGNITFFNDSGDELMRITSLGRVGIGTTTPAHKLHVIGNVNITGSFNATRIEANEILVNGAVVNRSISLNTYNFSVSLDDYNFSISLTNYLLKIGDINSTSWNRTGTKVFLANIGDNVGIGTTSPGMKLVVAGNVNISQNLTVNNSVLFVDGTSGRVGIGTTSPGSLLSVYDSSPSVNEVLFDVTTNEGAKFVVDEDGDITYDGQIKNTNTGDPTNVLSLRSTAWNGVALAGFVIDDGGPLGYAIYAEAKNSGSYSGYFKGPGNFNVVDSSGDSLFFVNGTSGNVGIGTTNPDHYLHIEASTVGQLIALNLEKPVANANVDGPILAFSNNEEGSSPVESGDNIGMIGFRASYASNLYSGYGAAIKAAASGTQSVSASGGQLEFYTTDDGTNTTDQRMTISDAGNLLIGTGAPGVATGPGDLFVTDALEVDGVSNFAGEISVDDIIAPTGTLDFSNDLVNNIAGLRIGDATAPTDNDLYVVADITAANDILSIGDIFVGTLTEAIADNGFNLDGNDLYVDGELGVNSVAFFDTTVTIDGTLDLDGNTITSASSLTITPAGGSLIIKLG